MARGDDDFRMRLPTGMRQRIKVLAADNLRSMNAEIVFHLKRSLAADERRSPDPSSDRPTLPAMAPAA